MAKFYGEIGYATLEEQADGVWVEKIVEKKHFGDVIRNIRRLESSDQVNDNVNISNEISIISDPFSSKNFHSIRYVKYMGSKWKVTNITVQSPRLILSLGGLYNNGQ